MTGHQMGGGKVHQDQVGIHANLQHTGFLGSALGSCAADCGHHEHRGSGQLGSVTAGDPFAVGSLTHDFKQIQITGFHSAVRTQRHIDTGFHSGGNGSQGQTVLGICTGGHHGSGLFLAENCLVLLGQGSAAGSGDGSVQNSVAVQKLGRRQTGTVQAVFHLSVGAGQVHLHAKAFFCTVVGNALPQLVIADIFGINAAVYLDAAVVVAVPLLLYLHQFPALLVGLKVEIFTFVDEAVGAKGHIALHAGFAESFGGGVGIIVEVRHRGNTKAQAFGNAQ